MPGRNWPVSATTASGTAMLAVAAQSKRGVVQTGMVRCGVPIDPDRPPLSAVMATPVISTATTA